MMYEATLAFFQSNAVRSIVQNVYVHIMYGDLLYFLDQTQEARTALQKASEIAQQLEKPAANVMYHAILRLQLCDLASGIEPQIDDATDADQWAQSTSVTPFASNIAYMRVLRDIKLGRLDRARYTLGTFGTTAAEITTNTPLLQRISLLTYEVHTNPDFDLVESLLRTFNDDCTRLGWTAFSMQARVLRLVHSLKRDSQHWDLQMLDALLAQIEATGLHRYILNFPQLAPMLQISALPFAAVLLRKFGVASVRLTYPFGLTRQEVLVLNRLADGRGTSEIADDIQISLGTVRTHLRNAFSKMNVHHRAEAIKTARDVGIISRQP